MSLDHIARALNGQISNGQVLAPGPGHSASDRSLSVKPSDEAPDGFLVHSFAGDDAIVCRDYARDKLTKCATRQAEGINGHTAPKRRSAANLMAVTLAAAGQDAKPKGTLIDIFDYKDGDGTLLYQVLKYDNPRRYSQRRPNGKGWVYELEDRRVLYRYLDLLKNENRYAPIFFTEGEKDADRLASLDLVATTIAHGSWTDECAQALAGRHVLILEDNDEAGHKRALDAAKQLYGIAETVRIVRLPGLSHKQDVSDWLDRDPRNNTVDKLVEICFDGPLWEPSAASEPEPTPAPEPTPDAGPDPEKAQSRSLIIKSSKEFIAGFVPPEYVVVGLLQRRFFYSLTGQTGSGKTAITLLLSGCAALGRTFAGHDTKPVRVLYLAAENADDVRMRWTAFAQQMDFDINTIGVYFVEGRFSLSKSLQILRAEAERHGGEFGLVIVDTGPTFFEGSDENENKQLGDHARMLRHLIDTVPGGPCVVANCHPTKNAQPDQLLPRGGGAFLNETDGNLTAAKTDSTVELHWQGKFRGPDFGPMCFLIRTVTHQDLKDSDSRLIPTVIAEHIGDQARDDLAAAAQRDDDAALAYIAANPTASLTAIAAAMGWKLYSGEPNKMKVGRCIKELIKAKLIKKTRTGRYQLTPEGKKVLNEEDNNVA